MSQLLSFLENHWILSSLFLFSLILLAGNELLFKWRGIPKISSQELVGLMNHEKALVVDIRPVGDYKNGHITSAKNIPHEELLAKIQTLSEDKTRPLVLVCGNGQRAPLLGALLKKQGFENVSYLDKGLMGWRQDNMPVVKG